MIPIGLNVNKAKVKSGTVHVYHYGDEHALCGVRLKPIRVAMQKAEPATCNLCWGQLYLRMSLEIDNLFGYPTPKDVEERETEAA